MVLEFASIGRYAPRAQKRIRFTKERKRLADVGLRNVAASGCKDFADVLLPVAFTSNPGSLSIRKPLYQFIIASRAMPSATAVSELRRTKCLWIKECAR